MMHSNDSLYSTFHRTVPLSCWQITSHMTPKYDMAVAGTHCANNLFFYSDNRKIKAHSNVHTALLCMQKQHLSGTNNSTCPGPFAPTTTHSLTPTQVHRPSGLLLQRYHRPGPCRIVRRPSGCGRWRSDATDAGRYLVVGKREAGGKNGNNPPWTTLPSPLPSPHINPFLHLFACWRWDEKS